MFTQPPSITIWKLACKLRLALATVHVNAAEPYFAHVTKIVDGDTLWVQPDAGEVPRKLRLQGVDAPEICQPGGAASRTALAHLVDKRTLRVVVKYVDDYGRGLARIEVAGQDVASEMVRLGQAWSNRWRKSPGPYASEEAAARQGRLGLFAQSNPESPRDFRQRHGSCYLPDSRSKVN